MNSVDHAQTPPASQSRWVIGAALACTWLVGGSQFIAIRWALASFPALFQMGTQFILGGLLLGLTVWLRGERLPTARQWLSGAVLGCLLYGGGYGLIALAETTVSSGLVVTFIAIVPSLIALMELPYGIRPDGRQWLGIALGLIGVIMLTLGSGFSASFTGAVCVASGCMAWALGSVWWVHGLPGGARLDLHPGGMGYASQMLTGGLILLVASRLVGEAPILPLQALAMWSWLYLMFACLSVNGAYLILLQRTTPSLAASYAYVNPVVGLVLGMTLANEVVTSFEWVSVGVVLGGVIVLLSRPAKQHNAA
jgi:drug/metabolite transporter (DMT)-like permease